VTRATDDLLDALHGMTAEAFLGEIKKYRAGEVLDKDGNVLPVPAALLTSAAKFLKDNGVDRPVRPGDAVDQLADELPDFDNVIPMRRPV
jgi:hypothetical protein